MSSFHFRCPCCGQHAPVDRLSQEEPFELTLFKKEIGGKRELTDRERELRRGMEERSGSAPGILNYTELVLDDEVKEMLIARVRQLYEVWVVTYG